MLFPVITLSQETKNGVEETSHETKPLHRHRPVWRGELALLAAVIINSFAVVLMLYSGAGISAISSVPYAFSDVFPQLSLGTWTYLFQGLLILSLMILRKRFVVEYLFSFVVGFVFSELMDLHELWISVLPAGLGWQIFYFCSATFSLPWALPCPTAVTFPSFPPICFPGNFPTFWKSDIPR